MTEVVEKYPGSPWAPRALVMRGDLEARQGTYQRDEVFGGSVPTAAITYRAVVERYGSSEAAAAALNKLARIYADSKRFDVAAATFQELGTRDAEDRFDAWFSAGEITRSASRTTHAPGPHTHACSPRRPTTPKRASESPDSRLAYGRFQRTRTPVVSRATTGLIVKAR